MTKLRLANVAMLSAAMVATAAAAAPAGYRTIAVDASHVVGELKPLRGVNGAPDMRFAGDAGAHAPRSPRPLDLSAAYRQIGVDVVRTHDSLAANIDSSTGALPSIFPPGVRPGGAGAEPVSALLIFPNPAADPNNPKSYNFAPTDALIKGIRAIGADVIFRLGRDGGTTAPAPVDLTRYGAIISHIVLHYNRGWAKGYQHSVRYWEVWNEPDLGKIWWRGTPDQYYQLYRAAAGAVKSADPTARIGGPTIAMVNAPSPYREGFLAFVERQRLSLDFFSWHYYSEANDPYDFVRIARTMRHLLDERGFKQTLSSLDEWNSALRPTPLPDGERAAFLASALIYMQDAPIDQQAYYRADFEFGRDGKSPTKAGQALVAWGKLSDTPLRLRASGGDDKGFGVLAGKSRDGKTVRLLISNYEIPESKRGLRPGGDVWNEHGLFQMTLLPRRSVSYARNKGYDVAVNGLAGGGAYLVERYGLSSAKRWAFLERRMAAGPVIHVEAPLVAAAVEMIVIRSQVPSKGQDAR